MYNIGGRQRFAYARYKAGSEYREDCAVMVEDTLVPMSKK
jgi:hypothetical protein